MATKNFTQFDLRAPLLTSDYIVGYKADGSAEYKATVKQVVDLVQDSDAQTLSFSEANKNLAISSGNTVSLSAFVQSRTTTTPSATAINNIVTLSQAAYDAIAVKDPYTLYYII